MGLKDLQLFPMEQISVLKIQGRTNTRQYTLGNRHIDLPAHNQLAEHVPDGEDPPLQYHMHTHLQHLPPIPHPGEPPTWVPDERMYNDTAQAYHYLQPICTMVHI